MLRVLISVFAALFFSATLAGCGSMISSQPTYGYAPNDEVLSYGNTWEKKKYTRRGKRNQRSARVRDKAPRGTYSKAPEGAFKGRDYTKTTLNVDTARKMINAYRASKGLKPLRMNTRLTNAAKVHAKDLAKHDRISHYGSDGSDPLVRVQRTGYPVHLAAENVGTGQSTLSEVFKGWQKSPGHNENLLLTEAREMGIALIVDDNTEYKTFWTLVLGTKRG